jgi:hypothetical protein
MAEITKRRARRAAKRVERQRRAAIAARTPLKPKRGPPGDQDPPPSWPDDRDGGAGVREPRRPVPHQPAGALEVEPVMFDSLDVAATPLR